MSLVLILVFIWLAFVVGWVSAPGRETTVEARTAKLREKSYARWYAAQIAGDEARRMATVPVTFDWTPHKAVNLLPYAVGER